jgi:hypothetical protein
LFAADESILPTAFASKLSVLLEDHIALRSFYSEVERHYQSIKTARLAKPLPRDAVGAIQNVIRAQTPTIFAESVSPAIDEAANQYLSSLRRDRKTFRRAIQTARNLPRTRFMKPIPSNPGDLS